MISKKSTIYKSNTNLFSVYPSKIKESYRYKNSISCISMVIIANDAIMLAKESSILIDDSIEMTIVCD